METAKQANTLIKEVLATLTDKNDIARFTKVTEIFNNASGMVNGSEYNAAMLKGWMVSQANNAVFLAWRRGTITPEIEAAYRELPATEEAVKDYDAFEEENKKAYEKLEEERKALMNAQKDIDIFKAILNGMSKEKAEAQYDKYQEQLAQAR